MRSSTTAVRKAFAIGARIGRALDAMMQMKKIDIATIEAVVKA
jgi:hypothetical protein